PVDSQRSRAPTRLSCSKPEKSWSTELIRSFLRRRAGTASFTISNIVSNVTDSSIPAKTLHPTRPPSPLKPARIILFKVGSVSAAVLLDVILQFFPEIGGVLPQYLDGSVQNHIFDSRQSSNLFTQLC